MVRACVSVIAENTWIRPDGAIERGKPSAIAARAFLPNWMIRVEGWAFVSRTLDRLHVRFDPRCTSRPLLGAMIDVIRSAEATSSIRSIELQYYSAAETVHWETWSATSACHHLLKTFETAQHIGMTEYCEFQQSPRDVRTDALDISVLENCDVLSSHFGRSLYAWKHAARWECLVRQLDGDGQFVALFRLEYGEPRAFQLGGGLMFTAPTATGARLADILPKEQAQASHERIMAAALTGQPVLRRHHGPTYDVTALSLPVEADFGTLVATIVRRNDAAAGLGVDGRKNRAPAGRPGALDRLEMASDRRSSALRLDGSPRTDGPGIDGLPTAEAGS